MNKILVSLLACLVTLSAQAEVWQARYGVAETFDFKLYNADGTLDVDEADGGTEVSVSCNEGAETTATNDFADEGTFYSIALTATEMQCERIAVVVAATTTEVFFIQTNNDASAMTPDIVQTGDSFARIGSAGAGLTNIDLPNQTMDITGTITTATNVTTVNGLAANVITAAATATDFSTEVNTAVLQALGVNVTTIATLSTQTSFTLTAGSADNDAYNNWALLVIDASTSVQRALGIVEDYVGATKTVTLRADPAIFTMAAGDTVVAIPAQITATVNANLTTVEGTDSTTYFDSLIATPVDVGSINGAPVLGAGTSGDKWRGE